MKRLLSIVLPSYNEEKNIPLVYGEIQKVIDTRQFDYEIIFVDDGSMDGTREVIKRLGANDKNVKGIFFSRNFGHAAALEAGLTNAGGDLVVMMDADLQHPPKLIPKLIEMHDKGHDIVNTIRLASQDASFMKRVTSKFFYAFMNSVSELKIHDGEADFRLMSRRAVNTLNSLPETPKFYRGLVNWVGYKVAHVEYKARSRLHGTSSYSLKKMLELARMGVTSFSLKPLKLVFTVGVVLTTLAFVLLVIMLIIKVFVDSSLVSYNAILTDILLLATGVLTIFQGVIALYLVDIFNTTKGRPTYIVKGCINLNVDK